MSQARKLLIVFGNDSAVVQTWAISAQRSIDVDPEEAAFFDITVTGTFLPLYSLIFLLFPKCDLVTDLAMNHRRCKYPYCR